MFNIFGPSARALQGMMPQLGGGQPQGQRMPQGMPGMDMMQGGMGQTMPPPMIDAGPSPAMQQQMMPPMSNQPPMAQNPGMRQKSIQPMMKAGQTIANKMKASKSAKMAQNKKPAQGGMMNRFRDLAMQLGPMAGQYMLDERNQ